jgi:hypothetical protein
MLPNIPKKLSGKLLLYLPASEKRFCSFVDLHVIEKASGRADTKFHEISQQKLLSK